MKRTNRMQGGGPFHYAPFLLRPGRSGSDSIPGAAFRVKQESGFVFSER